MRSNENASQGTRLTARFGSSSGTKLWKIGQRQPIIQKAAAPEAAFLGRRLERKRHRHPGQPDPVLGVLELGQVAVIHRM